MTAAIEPPPGPATDRPPDWATHTADVTCPLCGYNLRGLVEPRCPECGHTFTWRGLQDEAKWRHPYLFEHNPRRPVRSFTRTLWASLLPGRFFAKVIRPEHRPRVGWIIIYALIVTLLVAGVMIAITAWPIYQEWLQISAAPPSRGVPPYTLGQYLRDTFFAINRSAYWTKIVRTDWTRGWPGRLVPAFGVVALWPWLTLLSLLIFRDSMKMQRVLTSQVLRCVVYAAGVAVPLAIIATLLSQSPDVHDWLEAKVRTVLLWRTDDLTKCVALLCIPIFTYRLAVAYRRYLRFRHALLTVVLSQVLVVLLLRVLFQLWLDAPL